VAGKLFGTDGVRGVAGTELTAELALGLGRAAAATCEARRPQVLIVRDTRESGPMLESALAAGIAQAGGDALRAGVLPTPAASVLVRRLGLDVAAVISASHNPWQDNGIKLFGANGRKLADEVEAAIEDAMQAIASPGTSPPIGDGEPAIGRVRDLEGSLDDYLRELERVMRIDLSGRHVVLDCANGATHRAAPEIFRRLGAEVEPLGAEPDGRNINAGCGSTAPEQIAARIAGGDAGEGAVGFAFDGDGDRVLAVDETGAVRDGDELIALIATHLRDAGQLHGGIAVTVMSNYGFHQAMSGAGIEVATTPVGDRHVADELARREWALGGEQSGHLIWADYAPTGDGIAAALLALRALGSRRLEDAIPMRRLPQVLRNVKVTDRAAAERADAVRAAIERESAALEGRGRVLVRPSGTEPLVRVMVEAPEHDECEAACERIVAAIEAEVGRGGLT
jgi:phosphoglucosamine mutase